jgi:signal transduction histidine kinase
MTQLTSCVSAGDYRTDATTRRLLLAAIVGFGALTLWGEVSRGVSRAGLLADLVAGVLCCALVPLLTRRPVPAALLLALLAALSPVATPASTLGTLRVAHAERFRRAVLVGSVGALCHIARGVWRPMAGLSFGWWLTLVLITEAGLVGWGALSQARRALILSLRERAERAEAEQARRVSEARAAERTRIAREMHDVLAHRLSLLATYAGAIEYRPDATPEQLSRAAGVVRAAGGGPPPPHDALVELRGVIAVLRDDELDADTDDGPCENGPCDGAWRPQPTLADLPALVEESRLAGAPVRFDDEVTEPDRLPPATARTAYRMVQESLTNARKHAPGEPVHVLLRGTPGDRLTIEVSNPLPAGVGAPTVPGAGVGLVGLTERMRLAGGALDQQTSGVEFALRAWLPWPA